MDLYQLLKDDHRDVESLLDRLAEGEDFDSDLFQTLRENLLAHAHAEDEIVYAALAQQPDASSLIVESRQDHQALEGLLDELTAGISEDEDWTTKLEDLDQLLAEHVEFEETELIPLAQRLLDEETETHLAERFLARKEQLGAAHSE
ncbi:MAG TPA: hemerythrin domain-containing protein [Planctomycetota bacterium]|nr:hemerythrin domain-containing protein [Planctomycetota bacterium]